MSTPRDDSPRKGLARRIFGSAAIGFFGVAATAIPLHVLLRRKLRDAPEDMRAQGWPIRLMQVLFAEYIDRWIDVEGLDNLPPGSYLLAANHAYKSGVDGYILGHLLATHARRVPRILMTSEARSWMVRAERRMLHHYGIALLVPDETVGTRHKAGLSDVVATYLRESPNRSVIIFPAGRAIADPVLQLKHWSTGVVVAAEKSGCPVVPVAVGGLNLDWTPETVAFAALKANGTEPPFRFHVRIGKPIAPTADPHADLERLRCAIEGLMLGIPALRPAPGESDPAFGKVTLRDGRTLAYMDRGPRDGTPILYFHGFQGSRLERGAALDRLLEQFNIRLISPDRPGIGLSTPVQTRTLADWASDVQQLAEQVLGPGKPFSILGFSAGATYALACARLSGARAMSLVSGLGLPYLISGWRRLSKDAWQILFSAKLANIWSGNFVQIEKTQRDRIYGQWGTYIEEVAKDLSPDDQRILRRPDVEVLFQANRRESYAQCPGCMLQDAQALYSNPEIDLDTLATVCRVLIVHGTDDRVVPIEVARDLHARISSSSLIELEGRGHYFSFEESEMRTVLTNLSEAHRTCPLSTAG